MCFDGKLKLYWKYDFKYRNNSINTFLIFIKSKHIDIENYALAIRNLWSVCIHSYVFIRTPVNAKATLTATYEHMDIFRDAMPCDQRPRTAYVISLTDRLHSMCLKACPSTRSFFVKLLVLFWTHIFSVIAVFNGR